MASKPLDTYIKTPPPSNPASKETYLEQQLGAIEKVLQKHTNTIEDNYANNVASITEEQGVRATADSALAYSLQQLTATVNANNTSTQGQITNLQTAVADASSATATQLQTLTAKVDTNLSSTNASILNEQKVRATADSALATKVSSLSATVDFNNNKLQASIVNEATARVTADSAEATARQTLEATVTNNYNTLNSAITTEANTRATAITTEANARTSLQSFVGWDGGSYTSNLVQTMGTKVSKTDGASYEWSVQGSIDGATGGLRLTGAKRLNPTTNVVETTTNLIIDANTKINGDLIVSGTVSASRLATIPGSKIGTGNTDGIQTGNIAGNAVSNSAGATASSTTVGVSISLKAGDRVSVLCSCGPGPSSGGAYSGTLQAFVYPSSSPIGSVGITSMVESVVSVGGTLAASSKAPPASLLCFYTAPSDGSYYIYTVNAYASSISIMVVGLSR